jgi:hypothetical protein
MTFFKQLNDSETLSLHIGTINGAVIVFLGIEQDGKTRIVNFSTEEVEKLRTVINDLEEDV